MDHTWYINYAGIAVLLSVNRSNFTCQRERQRHPILPGRQTPIPGFVFQCSIFIMRVHPVIIRVEALLVVAITISFTNLSMGTCICG